MADISKALADMVAAGGPVLVTIDALDQTVSGVKTYVDMTNENSSTGSKEYTDQKLAEKLDKEFAGADTKIVTNVAATTSEDGSELIITATIADPKTGATETKTTNVPLTSADTITNLQNSMTAAENKLADIPEGKKAQLGSAALDSVAGLTGTGLVTMTDPDTFALKKVDDSMVESDTALNSAINAFAAKDGSIKAPALLDANGNGYVSNSTDGIEIGDPAKSMTFEAKLDANGKISLFMKHPATGATTRIAGIDEVKELIASAEAGMAKYRGKFTYFALGATSADAKALITSPEEGHTAVVNDTSANTIETGVYNSGAWTWTTVTWNGGDWCWVEDILGVSGVIYGTSGRVYWDLENKVFEVIEDREGSGSGSATPDNFGISYNEDGALSLKMITNAEQYGDQQVSAALNAGNLGYGDGMTIAQKIQSLEYSIATEEEIVAIIQKYFPTSTPETPPVTG